MDYSGLKKLPSSALAVPVPVGRQVTSVCEVWGC